MSETNDIADMLASFWKFMLIFALIVASLVTYVNAVGMMGKDDEETLVYNWYESMPPHEERILKIWADQVSVDERGAYTDGIALLPDMTAVVSNDRNNPVITLEGDGFIEVQYSDTRVSLTVGKNRDFRPSDTLEGRGGWGKMEGDMTIIVPANISRLIDFWTHEIIDWRFADVDSKYRDYNKIYNQYLDEVCTGVPVTYAGDRRFVFESYLFVTMYNLYRSSEVVATATIKLTSYDPVWRGSIDAAAMRKYGLEVPHAMEGITLELIDYWQIDTELSGYWEAEAGQ